MIYWLSAASGGLVMSS